MLHVLHQGCFRAWFQLRDRDREKSKRVVTYWSALATCHLTVASPFWNISGILLLVTFKQQQLSESLSRPDHRWDASSELQRCDASWAFKLMTAYSHCSCSTTPEWTVSNISVVERGTSFSFTVLSVFVLYRRLGKQSLSQYFQKSIFDSIQKKIDHQSAKSRKLNNRRTI